MGSMRFLSIFILLASLGAALLSLGLAPKATATTTTDPSYGLNTTVPAAGLPTTADPEKQLNTIIGSIINIILGITGVVFMSIIVAAGDLWMTADGNEEKITKARGLLFNGAVGLLIAFSAYMSAHFFINAVLGLVGA